MAFPESLTVTTGSESWMVAYFDGRAWVRPRAWAATALAEIDAAAGLEASLEDCAYVVAKALLQAQRPRRDLRVSAGDPGVVPPAPDAPGIYIEAVTASSTFVGWFAPRVPDGEYLWRPVTAEEWAR